MVRQTGGARGYRWASGAAQRFSIKKASDLLGKLPFGMRVRASLCVRLRTMMVSEWRLCFCDCG
jgi:hypothetical protein